ncbi:MAG: DUF1801 domain-containing protein [Lysobacter sp.]|nr:DUF1801 domain-containing protein [Lysobacter sp.]
MAEAKTKPTAASVAAFLAAIPDEERRRDCRTVAKLMQKATGAKPVLWGASMVGFGTYRYRYESGREGEWPVIGFSPRKSDLTLYIMPGFSSYADLLARLGRHKTSVSCLYLRKLADVDLEVLEAIIGKAVADMAGKRVDRPS